MKLITARARSVFNLWPSCICMTVGVNRLACVIAAKVPQSVRRHECGLGRTDGSAR